MSAPDFYFAIHAIFHHIHQQYGKEALVDYWRRLGREYYRARCQRWKSGGPEAVAADWREYFADEPGAVVDAIAHGDTAALDIRVCPAIKHLRDHGRPIAEYFCEHCDHMGEAMGDEAGYSYRRDGGMGACQQWFTRRACEEMGTCSEPVCSSARERVSSEVPVPISSQARRDHPTEAS
jgi:hypothetical protein